MIRACIIFHGYGSNGDDLKFIGLELKKGNNFEIYTPNAPFVNSLNKDGFEWFPIEEPTVDHFFDGLCIVENIVLKYIENITLDKRISYKEILLCGFSQGAALAVHIALKLKEEVAGVISFSGGFANPDNIFKQIIRNRPPILLIHGKEDKVLPCFYSEKAKTELEDFQIKTELNIIDEMQHSINDKCIGFAKNFIKRIEK